MLNQLCVMDAPPVDWELIAVNDGSMDQTPNILKSFLDRLPLCILDQPRGGKNRALNIAIDRARGQSIVLTDDDVLVDPDWLGAFHRATETHPNHDIFGGAILPHWEASAPQWLLEQIPLGVTYGITDPDLPAGEIYPGLVWGANMMVRRRVFDSGLRFNEGVGPAAGQYMMGSETEFNLRASSAGHRCCFVPMARVRHIICPHQLELDWILKRAFRFGRNVWNQEHAETSRATVPLLWGLPRWRLRSYAEHSLRARLCRLRGLREQAFMHDWEVKFLRGYFSQARASRA